MELGQAVRDFIWKVSLIKTKFYHFDYVVMLAGIHKGSERPHGDLCDVVTELRMENWREHKQMLTECLHLLNGANAFNFVFTLNEVSFM